MERSVVVSCVSCSQRLRAPVDLGALTLTCPSCQHRRDWTPTTLDQLLAGDRGIEEARSPSACSEIIARTSAGDVVGDMVLRQFIMGGHFASDLPIHRGNLRVRSSHDLDGPTVVDGTVTVFEGDPVSLRGIYGGVVVQREGVVHLHGLVFDQVVNDGGTLLVYGKVLGGVQSRGGLTCLVAGSELGISTGTVSFACLRCGYRAELMLLETVTQRRGDRWFPVQVSPTGLESGVQCKGRRFECRACQDELEGEKMKVLLEEVAQDPAKFFGPPNAVPARGRKRWWKFW